MPLGTTATTTLPVDRLGDAVDALRGFGFHDHRVDADARIMTKPGNRFALRGHQRPLAARLEERAEGVELELRYDQWLVFDSGELTRHAQRIADSLAR